MRKWIDLVEEVWVDKGQDMARALMAKHGAEPMAFEQLPAPAQKSVEHYMVVDGENEEFETNCLYAYAEIPTEEFMHAYWRGLVNSYEQNSDDFTAQYATPEEMYRDYREGDPSVSTGFSGYDFSKHDLEYPWPVIIGSDFFEDGAHRLALYVYKGLETVPCVMIHPIEGVW